MQQEIWFRPDWKAALVSRSLSGSWRALPEERKNNDYRPGSVVIARLHENGTFLDGTYPLLILEVPVFRIGDTTQEDFRGTDMDSRDELVRKFSGFYGRQYTESDPVRLVRFSYIQ